MENVNIVEALLKVFDNVEAAKKKHEEEKTTEFLKRFREHFQNPDWVAVNITVKKDHIIISDIELWSEKKCAILGKELSPAFTSFMKGRGELMVFRNKDYEKISKFRKFFLKMWYNTYINEFH